MCSMHGELLDQGRRAGRAGPVPIRHPCALKLKSESSPQFAITPRRDNLQVPASQPQEGRIIGIRRYTGIVVQRLTTSVWEKREHNVSRRDVWSGFNANNANLAACTSSGRGQRAV